MIRACVVICACGFIAQQAQPPRDTRPSAPGVRGTAAIEGTIVSDEAQPKKLRRARVTLNGAALEAGRTVVTDDEGKFSFIALPPGVYSLEAAKDGYISRGYASNRAPRQRRPSELGGVGAPLIVASGERRSVSLRLPRGAVITGVVSDPSGQPASGVGVTALGYRFNSFSGDRRLEPSGGGITDDRGVYRIFGLPAGEYVVEASARPVPVRSAELRLSTSDARGIALAPVMHPSATDPASATRLRLSAGEERTGIDIQLQYVPLATISGMVVGGVQGVRAATLARQRDLFAGTEIVNMVPVGPDGQFMFINVAPGRYTILGRSQSPPGPGGPPNGVWSVGSTDVQIDGDDVANVSIVLEPLLSLGGQLVLEGTAPPAAPFDRIMLPLTLTTGPPTPPVFVQSLDGGRFRIPGVAAGTYRIISATLPGIRTPIGKWWLKSIVIAGRDALDAPIEIRQSSDDLVVTLADQASALSGIVRDGQGTPLPDVFVVVFNTDRATWFFNSRRVAGVRTDGQGKFSVRNLPPGEYRAAVTLDLQQAEWFDPDMLQGLQSRAVPLTITGVESKTLDLVLR